MITKNCVKEFDYRITDNKPITKLPINHFSTKANIKPETLLYNITTTLSECNTADIDFTSGGENNKKLIPLSNRFCDNIVLYFVIPAETIKNSKVLQQYVNKEDNNKETTRLQTKILQEIGPYLAEHTEKIKRLFNTLGLAINKAHIKTTHPSTENGEIRQYIKVALPDIELDKIYNIITNTEVLITLNKEGIYINDIDFTQDFHGVINKKAVIEYLLQQNGFRREMR